MKDYERQRMERNGMEGSQSKAKRLDALRRKAWHSSPTSRGRRVLKDAEAMARRHAAITGD